MDEKTSLTAAGGYGAPSYSGGYGGMSSNPTQGSTASQGAPHGSYPPQGGAPGMYPPLAGAASSGYQQGAPPPVGAVLPTGGAQLAEPSAPPLDTMEQLPGYNNIGFEGSALPPPSYEEATAGPPPERENIKRAPSITAEEARVALLDHVDDHCCYGRSAAEQMKFNDLKSSSAFHYTLETFGEGRSTKWTCRPYKGEGLHVTGPPPGPWEVQVPPPQLFVSKQLEIEVPNTASVKPCFQCQAAGYKNCFTCIGSGRQMCTSCNGTGRDVFDRTENHHHDHGLHHHSSHHHGPHHHGPHHHGPHHHGSHHHRMHRHVHFDQPRACPWCTGGYKMCIHCNGSGRIKCHKCDGRANLRWFIQLTVKWTNHVEDHIVERTALPDELIRKVSGQLAFEETNPKVWPVNHFPEQEINAASNNLVRKHESKFPAERTIMQRHRVRIIPVTEVLYSYKEEGSSFFVYGFEHKVYAPDYPQQCCCGCSIL